MLDSDPATSPGLDRIADLHHGNASGFSRHYLTLYSLVLGMECKSVFEFGAGSSTKAMLSALEQTGGYLVSCDLRPLDQISQLGVGFDHTYWDRWIFLQGNSRTITNDLSCEFGPYDLVLCDGSHLPNEVDGDLRDIIPQMRRNSLLLVHDTEHPEIDYGLAGTVENALEDFEHSRVRLPFGYGLDIVRIEEDFGLGDVELTWRKGRGESNAHRALHREEDLGSRYGVKQKADFESLWS